MLTEDDKLRIRLEEQYRLEVRNGLGSQSQSKTWAFLNSAFRLWLLSTVAVGFITWAYQQSQQKHQESLETTRRKTALIQEIGYCLAPGDGLPSVSDALAYVQRLQNDTPSSSLLEQFKSRTFASLLWELETLDSEGQGSPPLLKSFRAITEAGANDRSNEAVDQLLVFCYYWAQRSNYEFAGTLDAPIGIVEENGRVRPLTKKDLDRSFK
jgi:hypothetical protein